MDVTRENFAQVYPQFQEDLRNCSFVAIDCEMTGIFAVDNENKQSKDDTPDVRYKKMVPTATKYSLIQYGVCLFKFDCDGNALTVSPYNFYLFPNYGPDISMSLSAISFLRNNGMDFGKWMNSGVTYCAKKGEDMTRKRLFPDDSAATSSPRKQITLSVQSDIDFIERNMARVKTMLEGESVGDKAEGSEGRGGQESKANSGAPEQEPVGVVEFEDCNAYLRRVIYEQVESRFGKEAVSIRRNANKKLCAYRVDPAGREEMEAKLLAEKEKELFDAVGFRNVFIDLANAKKPVVGHNMLFDLMFSLRALEGPLAPSFQQFRAELQQLFPALYDTKYVAVSGLLPYTEGEETTLEKCYQKFVESRHIGGKTDPAASDPAAADDADPAASDATVGPALRLKFEISESCSGFDPSSGQYHSAGYDAYCTGCVFAYQLADIAAAKASAAGEAGGVAAAAPVIGDELGGDEQEKEWGEEEGEVVSDTTFEAWLRNAASCSNMTFMMRSLFHMDLNPQRPSGLLKYRQLLLRLTGFDPAHQTSDILAHFCTATGGAVPVEQVEVIWVDNDSLFLHLPVEYRAAVRAVGSQDQQVENAGADDGGDGGGAAPMDESVVKEGAAGEEVSTAAASADWPRGWFLQEYEDYLAELEAIAEENLADEEKGDAPAVKVRAGQAQPVANVADPTAGCCVVS